MPVNLTMTNAQMQVELGNHQQSFNAIDDLPTFFGLPDGHVVFVRRNLGSQRGINFARVSPAHLPTGYNGHPATLVSHVAHMVRAPSSTPSSAPASSLTPRRGVLCVRHHRLTSTFSATARWTTA